MERAGRSTCATSRRRSARWQVGLADAAGTACTGTTTTSRGWSVRFGDDGEHRVRVGQDARDGAAPAPRHALRLPGRGVGHDQRARSTTSPTSATSSRSTTTREAVAGGADPAEVLAALRDRSRDNARTPMQWDDSPNAGFTTGEPWLAVNPNHVEINARAAVADPDSVFHHYRRLIELRHTEPVVVHGDFTLLLPDDPQVYAFTRRLDDVELLVLGNFGADPVTPVDRRRRVARRRGGRRRTGGRRPRARARPVGGPGPAPPARLRPRSVNGGVRACGPPRPTAPGWRARRR